MAPRTRSSARSASRDSRSASRGRKESDVAIDDDDDCGDANLPDASAPANELPHAESVFASSFLGGIFSAPAAAESGIFFTNARDGLNLRSGPGVEFPVIRSLAVGTRVHVVAREGRWGLIDTEGDGATDGFAHLAFLDQEPPSVPRPGRAIAADQVRDFWSRRNPRGARLNDQFGNPLVDPRLMHASAVAIAGLEAESSTYRYEMYGPGGGFRPGGSTQNHTAQPATGRGAAMDFVIIDRRTGRMLTNHPGADHQNQGTVGENAPTYQSFYNAVVRAGSQLYPDFENLARFGGYFATGANALDTMHIDMRGREVSTGGGSLRGGFTDAQLERWDIPENRPYV